MNASAGALFSVIQQAGGDNGWFFANMLWRARAALDRLLGGVGMRGRARELRVGGINDFWRVEALELGRLLRFRAEMLLPGRAWLQLESLPEGPHARLRVMALFEPRGLAGYLYWWLLYPIHRLIFDGMVDAIKRSAEQSVVSLPAAARQIA